MRCSLAVLLFMHEQVYLKIDYVIDRSVVNDVTKTAHADDSVYEHDEEQKSCNVDQGWEGYDQREQQFPNALKNSM